MEWFYNCSDLHGHILEFSKFHKKIHNNNLRFFARKYTNENTKLLKYRHEKGNYIQMFNYPSEKTFYVFNQIVLHHFYLAF